MRTSATVIVLVFFFVSDAVGRLGAQPALLTDRGGWTPRPGLLARALALRDLDAEAAKRAVDRLTAGSPRTRVDVLRAGIRLADRKAARACAVHLDWRELNAWEQARVVDLCLDGYTRPGTDVDFDQLRSMIGSVDMNRVLRTFPRPPYAQSATHYLANLHRQLLAEHIPALCALARARPELIEDVFDNLSVVLPRTDRYRPEVAALVLDRQDVPAGGAGLHPLLSGCIDRSWRDTSGDVDGWEARWLMQSTPGPADAARLLACFRRLHPGAEWGRVAILRAMRHLEDGATEAFLREAERAGADELEGAVAAASLAARGDADARGRLGRLARDDEWAFGLWLEVAPADAVGALRTWVLGHDEARATWALDAILRLDGDVRSYLHLDLSADAFDGVAQVAIASGVDGVRLARIGARVPRCNTRALARAACERLARSRAFHTQSLDYLALGFLEVAAPKAFRRALRSLADGAPESRALALDALLVIGDPPSGARLVAHLASVATRDADAETLVDEDELHVLARSPCPTVEAHITGVLAACPNDDVGARHEALVALAALGGLPPDTIEFLLSEHRDAFDAAAHRRMCDGVAAALRADDGSGAVARLLAAMPDRLIGELWRIDTRAVRAHLMRLRVRRDLRLYAAATAHLAAMGDPVARAETESVMRAGRYRWMDSAIGDDTALATLGYDFTRTIPFWLDQLESNCCRRVLATCVFDYEFDLEPEMGEGVCETPATRMRRWWAENRDATFGRSWIRDGRFVPVRN